MKLESLSACSRRRWLAAVGSAALAVPFVGYAKPSGSRCRDYHVCLAPPVVEREPELLDIVRAAGVDTVWLVGYFYGFRPYPQEQIIKAQQLVARAGLRAELLTIPLGHPGNALLGAHSAGNFPLTPPEHWRLGERPDGKRFAGTSLHAPATEENAAALRELRRLGFRSAFVDDDFRLARHPGEIGGCFCARTVSARRAGANCLPTCASGGSPNCCARGWMGTATSSRRRSAPSAARSAAALAT